MRVVYYILSELYFSTRPAAGDFTCHGVLYPSQGFRSLKVAKFASTIFDQQTALNCS